MYGQDDRVRGDVSTANPKVLSTFYDDGSADLTITLGEDDHKFSVSKSDDSTATVSYQESSSWLGVIRVSEPSEDVYKMVIQSREMTEYLERHDLDRVVRNRKHD